LGPDRRPQTGLTKEEFRVLDNGQEQTIAAFSKGEEPLDLLLLFDVSGSMRRHIARVASAAHQGLQELRPMDCVSVMAFNSEAWEVAPFSENLSESERAIRQVVKLHFSGSTRIQSSIYDAANRLVALRNRNRRRRAVLVVTDNLGIPSHRKKAAIEELWEADALLGGLVVTNRMGLKGLLSPLGTTRPGGIEDIVEQTGGDFIRSDDLGRTFPEMMRRIRTRYTLYYRLPEGEVGSLRTIDVQLSEKGRLRFPGARVLARRGYRLQQRDRYGFATER
jgi:Ca-activated chloride channel homolog